MRKAIKQSPRYFSQKNRRVVAKLSIDLNESEISNPQSIGRLGRPLRPTFPKLRPIAIKASTPSTQVSPPRAFAFPPATPHHRGKARSYSRNYRAVSKKPDSSFRKGTRIRTPIKLTTPRNARPNLTALVTQTTADAEHKLATYHSLMFTRILPASEWESKVLTLPNYTQFQKLFIFDLDETLVHWQTEEEGVGQIVVYVNLPNNPDPIEVQINIRPFAVECLKEVAAFGEVAVFTASHPAYADAVLDHLDPQQSLISHRLYRHNCVQVEGVHIKDLRIISNWDLKDVVIIDNAAYSFGYQIDNGIPIISWSWDRQDTELYNLVDYLKRWSLAPDVRKLNRETFRLFEYWDMYEGMLRNGK